MKNNQKLVRAWLHAIVMFPAWLIQWPFVRFLGSRELSNQPVFIIGAPRTGSTILYQALSNYFDVTYIDNLACRFHRALLFGLVVSRLRFGTAPHENFSSRHGDTSKYGAHAPSECGGFWYRWLSRERHFIDFDEVKPSMVTGIRRELAAASNLLARPILIKNMNAGQRLRLIKQVFPDAKLIYIRRQHVDIVRSIKAVRRATGTPSGELWSIRPRNFAELSTLPEDELIAAQVESIEAQIDLDIKLFDPANVLELHYEDFSAELIAGLGAFLSARPRHGGSIPSFNAR